jgi:hypothetical protein
MPFGLFFQWKWAEFEKGLAALRSGIERCCLVIKSAVFLSAMADWIFP